MDICCVVFFFVVCLFYNSFGKFVLFLMEVTSMMLMLVAVMARVAFLKGEIYNHQKKKKKTSAIFKCYI